MRLMDLIDEKFDDYNENKYRLCEALMNLDEDGEEAPAPASEAPASEAAQETNPQEQNQEQEDDQQQVAKMPRAYLLTYCYPSNTNIDNYKKIYQKMQKDDIFIIPTDREKTKNAYSFIPNRVGIANILPILNENIAVKQDKAFCCGEFIASPIAAPLEGREIMVSQAEFDRLSKQYAVSEEGYISFTKPVTQEDGTTIEVETNRISVDPDLRDYDVATNKEINTSLDPIIKILNTADKAQVEKGDSQFNKTFSAKAKQVDEKTVQIVKTILMYSNWKDNEKRASDLNQEADKETKGGSVQVNFNSKLVDGIIKGLQNKVKQEVADLTADIAGGNALMQSVIGNAAKVVGNLASTTINTTKKGAEAAPAKGQKDNKFKDTGEAADYKLDMVLRSEKVEPQMTALKKYFGSV